MTHRPRTDIFQTLPQLLVLANLKEILRQNSWDEQAIRMQAEANQMAWLQYLQTLLQPPHQASSMASTFPTDLNHLSDMDSITFLNSLSSMKENPDESQVSSILGNTSLQGLYESLPFSHLPELQNPAENKGVMAQASNEFTVLRKGETCPNSPWIPASETPSPPPPPPPAAVTEVSFSSVCDASSSSGNIGGVGSSMWADLFLDDPLFQDIA